MNYILDTNVISEMISKKPDKDVLDFLDSLDADTTYLTVITIGEIRKGIEILQSSSRKETIRIWLETDLIDRFQGRVLNITTEVMLTWGKLVGQLENKGKPMPAIDSLIAAIALHTGFALVTRNEGDFQHTGVTIINPWES